MHIAPPHELTTLTSPWLFNWWGMDILGPFTQGSYQNRYLIVAVDYFTKWIEAEALAKITSSTFFCFNTRPFPPRWGWRRPLDAARAPRYTQKYPPIFIARGAPNPHLAPG